jgi:hypothetical protein
MKLSIAFSTRSTGSQARIVSRTGRTEVGPETTLRKKTIAAP